MEEVIGFFALSESHITERESELISWGVGENGEGLQVVAVAITGDGFCGDGQQHVPHRDRVIFEACEVLCEEFSGVWSLTVCDSEVESAPE